MSSEAFHNAIEQIIEDKTGVSYGWVCGIEKAADAILAMSEMQALLAKDAEIERLRTAGDALHKALNQFGDIDNWTHDDGFLFHDEALAAIAAWEEARRG